jgi:membrane-bound lytic murein transglycosylase D
MGPTAEQYGLRVDDYVDERRDPVRATDAALNYLQWLYDRFGSWYLAAAAYNAGPGGSSTS